MKRKEFKQLGDPTVQAGELATVIKNLSGAELLALAHQKHAEMEEAGELDGVGDEQTDAPPLDDSMVGSKLEVCWRYWRPPTDEEMASGEKRKKIGVKMWCEGTVEQVANGTSVKETPRCKSLLKAGALRTVSGGRLTRHARRKRASRGTSSNVPKRLTSTRTRIWAGASLLKS